MKTIRYYFALLLSLGLTFGPISSAHAGLESATYVSSLNSANPTAGDPVSQADDHLRLVKSVLQSTFPEASAPIYGLRSGTAVATTSGTTVDFTSIPSWVKRITINFAGVSTSGTSNPLVQIGDSGGVEATGYLGGGLGVANAGSVGVSNYTAGFGVPSALAANVIHGRVVLELLDASANTWTAAGSLMVSNSAAFLSVAGSKSLSATLDRVRVTTANGTDTFDAGSINILYE